MLRVCALCAHLCMPLALAWAWMDYFHPTLGVGDAGVICVLCGVAGVYGLDRLFDSDTRMADDGWWMRPFLMAVVVVAGGIAALSLHALSMTQWLLCGLCCAVAVAQWGCKKVPYAKTLCVVFSWVCGCALMPLQEYDAVIRMLLDVRVYLWAALCAVACVLCDMKDVADDGRRGIRSLPLMHGVGATRIGMIAVSLGIALAGVWAQQTACVSAALALAAIALHKKILSQHFYAALVIDSSLVVCAFL